MSLDPLRIDRADSARELRADLASDLGSQCVVDALSDAIAAELTEVVANVDVGADGKTIVVSVLKRGDCAYTPIVPDMKKTMLRKAIRNKVARVKFLN